MSQELAGSSETALDFVCDEQDVVLLAKFRHLLEVSWKRQLDSGFSLDWLNDEGSDIWVRGELFFQSLGIIVGNQVKVQAVEGAKLPVSVWVLA